MTPDMTLDEMYEVIDKKDAKFFKYLTDEVTTLLIAYEKAWVPPGSVRPYVEAWLKTSNGLQKIKDVAHDYRASFGDGLAPLTDDPVTPVIPKKFYEKVPCHVATRCPLNDFAKKIDEDFVDRFCRICGSKKYHELKFIYGMRKNPIKAHIMRLIADTLKKSVSSARDTIDLHDKLVGLATADAKLLADLDKLAK